jgi:uncharacterized protein with PQ loop repeat
MSMTSPACVGRCRGDPPRCRPCSRAYVGGVFQEVLTVYAIAAVFAPTLAIRPMLGRNGSTDDVSLGMLAFCGATSTVWTIYGLAHDDVPMTLSSAIGILCALVTIAVYVTVSRRARSVARKATGSC